MLRIPRSRSTVLRFQYTCRMKRGMQHQAAIPSAVFFEKPRFGLLHDRCRIRSLSGPSAVGVLSCYCRSTVEVLSVYTGVAQVWHRCGTGVAQVMHRCTVGLLLEYCGATVGVLLDYCWETVGRDGCQTRPDQKNHQKMMISYDPPYKSRKTGKFQKCP